MSEGAYPASAGYAPVAGYALVGTPPSRDPAYRDSALLGAP